MNKDLMLEFSVGGGRPPASSELLRVSRDASVTYLVGNALPRDEAGLYRGKLAPPEMRALEDSLDGPGFVDMLEKYGPIRPDSGFQTLALYHQGEKKKIKWGTFARLPGPLQELQTRLSKIIEDSRQHPLQTVKATLAVIPDDAETDKTLRLECSLQNCGRESIQLFMFTAEEVPEFDFRVYAATSEEAEAAFSLTFYEQAQPLRFVEPVESQIPNPIRLAPGEHIKVRALHPSDFSHNFRLYGFLEFTMAVTLDDELTRIRCSIMTKPTTLVS
jgi:hypothetical protein